MIDAAVRRLADDRRPTMFRLCLKWTINGKSLKNLVIKEMFLAKTFPVHLTISGENMVAPSFPDAHNVAYDES